MLYAQSISKEPPTKYYQGLIAELCNAIVDLSNQIQKFIQRIFLKSERFRSRIIPENNRNRGQ